MNAEGKDTMSAAKARPERAREEPERLEDSAMDAEAIASAASLEESAVNAKAMDSTKLEKEATLPEPTIEKGDSLKDVAERPSLELTARNNEFGTPDLENQILKTDLNKSDGKLITLNNDVEALHIDNQLLKDSLNKAHDKIAELTNGMQGLHRAQEILETNLSKAEDEVTFLFGENRALDKANNQLCSLLEKERKHRSERTHSASNTTRNRDEIVENTPGGHSAVDILALSSARELQQRQQHDQLSSEGEEPTELDPKDKGLFNFLKAVANVACTAINAFNVGFCVLAYNASGRHATSEAQKLTLAFGAIFFMPFSIVTAGMVHGLEGKAKDIDVATGCVFSEISYAFLIICLVAIYVAKVPWYVVVPLFFVICSLTTSWLVSRYRRPRGLYKRLRSLKKRFKDKAQRD